MRLEVLVQFGFNAESVGNCSPGFALKPWD